MTIGRHKGNRAERAVAKDFQKWWAQVEPDSEFVRTPLSGGWGGPTLRAEFGAAGDLMTTAKQFPFAVEIKHREGWTFSRFIKRNTTTGFMSSSPVWEWWWQTQRAAEEMKKWPIMLLRHNREDWAIMVAREMPFRMPSPDYIWGDLQSINYGTHEPVLYEQRRFFSIHPKVFT